MATWSITPSTASIDGNGLATIPKNTSDSPITYTVTYNDGNGGSGQVTYVVNPCPTTCSCDSFNITSTITIPSSGGSSGSIGSWVGNCPPEVKTKPDWVTVHVDSDHSIWIDTTENTSSDSREDFVVFSYDGVSCDDKKLEVTQKGKGLVDLLLKPNKYTIPKVEVNGQVVGENIPINEEIPIPVKDSYTITIYRDSSWNNDSYSLLSETGYNLYPLINGAYTCGASELRVLYDDGENKFFGRGSEHSHNFMEVQGPGAMPCPNLDNVYYSIRDEGGTSILTQIYFGEDASEVDIDMKQVCNRNMYISIALYDAYIHCTDYISDSMGYDYEPKDVNMKYFIQIRFVNIN